MAYTCTVCRMPTSFQQRRCAICEMDTRQRLAAQPSLFDAPRPGDVRATDPLPSRKAAAVNQVARATQKKEMLARLLTGPQSSRTLADITGNQVSRASKRLGEMAKDKLIYPLRYEKQAGGGTPVTVYALTEAGARDAQLLVGSAA